jgi:CO/xanthine dehydrogenase FAD-binding subunit
MDAPLDRIIIPLSLQELFSIWNRFPDAIPYAGGTNINVKQDKKNANGNPIFLCIDKLTELHRITRTEHYLEIGSMVKLNKLISLGKIVPEVLRTCLEFIAGVQLRNIATIGGNICSTANLFDIPAPLVALDAQYEFRNSSNSARWVSAGRFHSATDQTSKNNQELLTRIRLPLHQWDYAVYKKFNRDDYLNSEAIVFLANTKKNILSEIRVVYKAGTILRNKTSEDIINGKHLPLSLKTADDYIENWKEFLKQKPDISEFTKSTLLNSIQENIYNLSE